MSGMREDGLQPEIHDSGPQDLIFEALICALGLDSYFFPIHSPTNTLSLQAQLKSHLLQHSLTP